MIARCIILPWERRHSAGFSGHTAGDRELDVEIENSIELAGRVLATLLSAPSEHLAAGVEAMVRGQ